MPIHYSIVHYVPDPIKGERINFGVIAYRGDDVRTRFISNWRRLRHFAEEDIGFLQSFASTLEHAAHEQRPLPGLAPGRLDEAALMKATGSWVNSIQFSQPKASTREDLDALVRSLAQRLLVQPTPARRKYRDRRAAAAIAVRAVRRALKDRGADDLFKKRGEIAGRLTRHVFDAVVANRRPVMAAHGLSFENPDPDVALGKEVDATAWSIDDVKGRLPDLPLGLVLLPPREGGSNVFEEAVKVFGGLGATVLLENEEVVRWAAASAATSLP